MAVFSSAVGGGDLADLSLFGLVSLDNVTDWKQSIDGSDVGVLAALSYTVDTTTLADLQRSVSCNGVAMNSLGVVPWNNAAAGGWLEVFGLIGVSPGKPQITGVVNGADISPRAIRGSSLAFTGAGSFGAVTTAFGTGTALAVAANASPASMIAGFFSTKAGLMTAGQTQRYVNNTSVGLMISEARGTGSSFNLTAARAVAGPWAAASVVITPADTVASVQPLVVAPRLSLTARRLPRPTGPRRVVFTVEPEN